MISRWVWFGLCAMLGLVMVVCGLLVPAHLRAVDVTLIERAGKNTPTVVQECLQLVNGKHLGAARLLFETAQSEAHPGTEKLGEAVDHLTFHHPNILAWGSDEPFLEKLFGTPVLTPTNSTIAFTTFIIRSENRQKALEHLRESRDPLAQSLTHSRTLTNTTIFSPSQSSSGQAFDAALAITGLLGQQGHLTPQLSNSVWKASSEASLGGDSRAFEQMLLDFTSLGQRFNWGQLAIFARQIPDAQTLSRLANIVRRDAGLPVMFTAVELSRNPSGVAAYLTDFGDTGMRDLQKSLRSGKGGVTTLLRHNQQLYSSEFERKAAGIAPLGALSRAATEFTLRMPWFALTVKWMLYLAGGFLLAASVHFAKRVPVEERPLQVRGFHLAREFLFALGFLLAVLLLSEPFLAQASQKTAMPFQLRLPTVGSVIPAKTTAVKPTSMNQSLITLLLFFVIQGLIYTACLVKLAEIRRQTIPARIKLKLLENEDHLFDAGIYVGFVGTIVSLILVSVGIASLGLMAAYSSTSFGIVFVSAFKIFNLRPLRRQLLLESEAIYPETATSTVAPASARPLTASL